jgi:spermidine/putrescine transport system permease protein
MIGRRPNPWPRPRLLAAGAWLYMVWALLPVVVAILFSFNSGRSRSVWQGFSVRWWWGDETLSLFHRADYTGALAHSLQLALLAMAIATPLGVALALGLTRWHGPGSRVANLLMLVPLVTPELVMAASLLLLFTQLAVVPFSLIKLGTTAQVIGQVTFSLPYVVVIVRSRLASIGTDLEEAARDLGARPLQALRTVLLPLLLPAVLASTMVVFALSMDDFVVTQYLSSDHTTATIPMHIYSSTRGAATPALNALASLMVFLTLLAVALAFATYRLAQRWSQQPAGAPLRDLVGAEA